MFGYNPTVNDRSGEIQAAGQLQGAQGIAGGISQAAGSISGAIDKIDQLKMKAGQTDAAAMAAQKMGIFNSEQDPDGTQALQMIQNTPYQYKADIMPSLLQMVGTKATLNWHMGQNAIRQQALDMRAGGGSSKNMGIMPWNSTPAPGGLGGSGSGGSSDDSSQ